MSPTRSFVLPSDGSVDAIMVGPNRSCSFPHFSNKDINGDTGRNWLFFGDWTEEGEYYYRDEMSLGKREDSWTSMTLLGLNGSRKGVRPAPHEEEWERFGSGLMVVRAISMSVETRITWRTRTHNTH